MPSSFGCINALSSIFSGLDHLEGETVGILADGKVLDQQVVTNGAITLPQSYAVVQVGLPYYSDLETLDIQVELRDGTSQGSKIKVGNVMYRFVESKGGWIGSDEDSIYDAFTDIVLSHNSSEMIFNPEDYTFVGQDISDPDPYLYSGIIRKPLGGSHENRGRSFFRQVDPFPVTVTQVIPEIQPGGAV